MMKQLQYSIHRNLFILLVAALRLSLQTSELKETTLNATAVQLMTDILPCLTKSVNQECCTSNGLFPNITQVVGRRSEDVHSLNTTFTWNDGGATDLSYEVALLKIYLHSDENGPPSWASTRCFPNTCQSIVEDRSRCAYIEKWYNTSSNNITLEAPYSFLYHLFIRPWNRSSGVYMYGAYLGSFEYEACFPATSDEDFCSEQEIELASAVVDLKARVLWAGEFNVSVLLSWVEPSQINVIDNETISVFFINVYPKPKETSYLQVNYEKMDPTKVYYQEIALDPLPQTTQFVTYEVRVTPLFTNSRTGKEKAIVQFNLTQYVDGSNITSTTDVESSTPEMISVTTPGRKTVVMSNMAISLLSVCVLLVVILTCVCSISFWCHGDKSGRRTRENEEDICQVCHPIFSEKELYDPNKVKYDVTSPIGTGQYGNVYKGEVLSKDGKEWTTVAVKVAKEHNIGWKEDFLDEIKLILQLGLHSNIIEIYGCCTMTSPPLLITEFMRYGDLLRFLHKCRVAESSEDDVIYSVTEADLIYIAQQVAKGMSFISELKFYHGDLAARNILISEGLTAKISDFGLSDDLYIKGYKRMAHGRKRPMRWVSLETLKSGYCSDKSDVWSYGVLLFEIFTLGATPYHDIPIHEIATSLQDGYRLPKPDSCPQEIYNTMRQCWCVNPSERPYFSQLGEILDCLQQANEENTDSGSSFVSCLELRNAIFQPHFEEDEMPSLPVSPSAIVDSSSFDSQLDADSESNIGSVVDSGSGSIDTSTNFYPFDRLCSMESHCEEERLGHDGFQNRAFDAEDVGENDDNRDEGRSKDVERDESDEVVKEQGKEQRERTKERTMSGSLEDEGIVNDDIISDMVEP